MNELLRPAAMPAGAAAAERSEALALHRTIVGIPSVSGDESALADRLTAWLAERGLAAERIGNSLYVECGTAAAGAPLVLFDTHLDTVPVASGWTRPPFAATVEGERVYGLGANDAKASVAAMCAAVAACATAPPPFRLGLALVEGEETRSVGTERVLAHLAAGGRRPAMAVLGEPTGLEIAIAQKGLMVLELVATGDACHAAHAAALGARNAARRLARDLVALDLVDLGAPDSELGPTTVEPTVVRAGEARNAVPGIATAVLDVRSTPALAHDEIVARLRAVLASEVRVVSDRLRPRSTPLDAPLVRAARRARPAARCFASPTLSDMALMPDIPAIKVGPGDTRRSHTADEYVLVSELLDGEAFYRALIRELAAAVEGDPA